MDSKLLPIGSVVNLNKNIHPIMITGYKVKKKNAGVVESYDYVGCLYPEGEISSDITFAFNRDKITKVVFEGFSSPEYEALLRIIDKNENNNFR